MVAMSARILCLFMIISSGQLMAQCPEPYGDFNGDGNANLLDFVAFVNYFCDAGSGPVNPCQADVDGDCDLDADDIQFIIEHALSGTPLLPGCDNPTEVRYRGIPDMLYIGNEPVTFDDEGRCSFPIAVTNDQGIHTIDLELFFEYTSGQDVVAYDSITYSQRMDVGKLPSRNVNATEFSSSTGGYLDIRLSVGIDCPDTLLVGDGEVCRLWFHVKHGGEVTVSLVGTDGFLLSPLHWQICAGVCEQATVVMADPFEVTCIDGDGDGFGDPGHPENSCVDDNCPYIYNPDQADHEGDRIGDVCDDDDDNDGWDDIDDNCPWIYNPDQADAEDDGLGDVCDECTDTDGDGYGNPEFVENTCPEDNCPLIANLDQIDSDNDGIGDPCDPVVIQYINPAGTGDAPTIQAAVDQASNGDTIYLAPGIYSGEGNRDIVITKSIGIKGEADAENTIIDCQGSESEPHGGILAVINENRPVCFYNLTIQNGYNHDYDHTGAWLRHGSGLYIIGSEGADEFYLENCILLSNHADSGGGGITIFSAGGGLKHCTISQNSTAGQGGGIELPYIIEPVYLDSCLIEDNYSESKGGGIYFYPYVMSIVHCILRNNTAQFGGGMYWEESYEGEVIRNCVFDGNTCLADGVGSGIFIFYVDARLENCTFVNNVSQNQAYPGAAAYTFGLDVDKCLFAFNTGTSFSWYNWESSITISCSDIYGNSGGDWVGEAAGQNGVDGNFSADPLICYLPGGDYNLQEASPCRPDATGCGLIGAGTVGCDGTLDPDNDGIASSEDNCPEISNPDQADVDNDGIGDVCDECTDTDGDDYGNPGYGANTCELDNCPYAHNPLQEDSNDDDIGDACTYEESTPDGQDIEINLGAEVDLTFDDVSAPGSTELTITATGPVGPSAFEILPSNQPTYYNIATTAAFNDFIEVCIHYDDANMSLEDESSLTLQHYDGFEWQDITSSIDADANIICGLTDELSPFIIAKPKLYTCGDANGDMQVNVGDAVFLISYVFKGGSAPDPACSGNANGDGDTNVGDAVYLISYVFKSGPAPVAPCCQ